MQRIMPIALPIYAVVLMAILLDVDLKKVARKNLIFAALFACFVILANMIVIRLLGIEFYRQYYLFLVHLPVYICFRILSRFKGIKLLFTLVTTITFSALPINGIFVFGFLAKGNLLISLMGYAIACAFIFIVSDKLVKKSYVYMLEYGESKLFAIFCIIPVVYYLYGYLKTGYNFMNNDIPQSLFINRVPLILVIASYVLLVYIFKCVHDKQLLQNEKTMMHLQLETAKLYIRELKDAEQQTMLYRHDMRHHLSLIGSYLAAGETEKLQRYLCNVQKSMDDITPVRYCENQTVNLIVASFASKAKEAGITLDVRANLPEQLPVTDHQLCAILSNTIENAIHATVKINDGRKKAVQLRCEMRDDQLLISVKNPYVGEILFEDGIPQNLQNDHGLGVKSVISIVEKHGGVYSFGTNGGLFVAQLLMC